MNQLASVGDEETGWHHLVEERVVGTQEVTHGVPWRRNGHMLEPNVGSRRLESHFDGNANTAILSINAPVPIDNVEVAGQGAGALAWP